MSIALRSPPAPTLWLSEIGTTFRLAWPLIVTNLAQTGMSATDVLMMGWLGPSALAAGALGTNLLFPFAMFGLGLVAATSAMMARELGRNRHAVREIRRTVRQGLWTSIAIAVPAWVVLWQTEPILLLLGQNPDLARDAGIYMHAFQWSLLPFYAALVMRSFLAAMQRPLGALVFGVAALALNAFANWCLIFGNLGFPRLELVGAGYASTFASAALFLGFALYVLIDRKFRRYRLFGRFWRADWPRFADIWRLGAPIGVALLFEVTIFNAAVFLMGLIGAASLAAHSIAIQIASLSFMVPVGFGQAATVRVGRALGAGDDDAIRRAGWSAFALGVGFMAMMGIAMIAAPRLLIDAFLDFDDPATAEVVRLAVSFLAVAAIFQVFDGAQAVASGMLRGLHDTRVPMLFAAIGYWGLGLPLGAYLGFRTDLAGIGIWIGLASGLAFVAVLMTGRFLYRRRFGLLPPGA
jgi:MATE family multidrug resistance protein